MRVRVLTVLTAGILLAAAAPPPNPAPPGVEIREDGSVVALPSGLRLPRTVRGPAYTHVAMVRRVDQTGVSVDYGPITVTIGPIQQAADPVMLPPGTVRDDSPPALPALLLWGELALPESYSFPSTGDGGDWLAFVVVTQGWQIQMSSLYARPDRDLVIRTAEAVWATLAAANANPPRR